MRSVTRTTAAARVLLIRNIAEEVVKIQKPKQKVRQIETRTKKKTVEVEEIEERVGIEEVGVGIGIDEIGIEETEMIEEIKITIERTETTIDIGIKIEIESQIEIGI